MLVDNSPLSYSLNQQNGIPISSWYDDPKDTDLLTLIPLLNAMLPLEDVKSVLMVRTQAPPSSILPLSGPSSEGSGHF